MPAVPTLLWGLVGVARFGPDVRALMRKLLEGYPRYFSYDVLNSEGRKVFEEMARMLVHEHPEYKPMIKRVRRRPTLDNVLKVARLVLGEEAERMVHEAVQGPHYGYMGW
ncbi:MAG: hypothetical protein DRJ56_08190 [Thermoprotei archaeon]|nr:MAG: hypothetical protein DRJ56_08190 [Thermoprotei archaeon]